MAFFNRLRGTKQENQDCATTKKFSHESYEANVKGFARDSSSQVTSQPLGDQPSGDELSGDGLSGHGLSSDGLSGHGLSGHGLSLFSGMTLSGLPSPDKAKDQGIDNPEIQPSKAVITKTSCKELLASQELEEVFAGLDLQAPVAATSSYLQDNETSHTDISSDSASVANSSKIDAKDSFPASQSVKQHPESAKKKKRSQTRRPGYAREGSDKNREPVATTQDDRVKTSHALMATKSEPSTLDTETVNTKGENIVGLKSDISCVKIEMLEKTAKHFDEHVDDVNLTVETHGDLDELVITYGGNVFQETDDNNEMDINASHKNGDDDTLGDVCIAPATATAVDNNRKDIADTGEAHVVDDCNDDDNNGDDDDEGVVDDVRDCTVLPDGSAAKNAPVTAVTRDEDAIRDYDLHLDPCELFSVLEQDLQFKLAALSEENKELNQLEQLLMEFYSTNNMLTNQDQKELEHLQQEESIALASDNYDLAEELNSRIEELKLNVESRKYQLPSADEKVEKALKLRAEIAQRSLSIQREAIDNFSVLREEQDKALSIHQNETNTKLVREKQRLNSERQRIDRASSHLQLDKEHLAKEEKLLTEEIQHRTEEFTARRQRLLEERDNIMKKITELERQLAELRSLESNYTRDIEEEEQKIEAIKSEFGAEQDQLTKQRLEAQAKQRDLDSDQQCLTHAQENYDQESKESRVKEQVLQNLMTDIARVIDEGDVSMATLQQQQFDIELFHSVIHLSYPKDHELNSLRKSTKEFTANIRSMTTTISLSERSVLSLRKQVSEIEQQIAEREEAKEIAKQERNFKEAKRLKEEKDRLTIEGTENQNRLETLLEKQIQDKNILKEYELEKEKSQAALEKREHETDMTLIRRAAQVERSLIDILPRFSNNKILHLLTAAEISTCKKIRDDLCTKYGIERIGVEETEVAWEESIDEPSQTIHRTQIDKSDILTREDLLNQLDELEGKLEAVVEMEDFDEAERIQHEIDELNTNIKARS